MTITRGLNVNRIAEVVELVDLASSLEGVVSFARAGSSPAVGTSSI